MMPPMKEVKYVGDSFNKLVGSGGKFPGVTDEMYEGYLKNWLKRKGLSESSYYIKPEIKNQFQEDFISDLNTAAFNKSKQRN